MDPVTGCWIWEGALTGFTGNSGNTGYGTLKIDGKCVRAHVYFWTQKHGPVPAGKELHHEACKNTRCCNPDHLEAVSHADNIARAFQ